MSDNSKSTQNDGLGFELGAWLDHTQQLDQEARPGPWASYDGTVGTTGSHEVEPDFEPLSYTHIMARADAEWIAHARTALPAATAALWAVLDLHEPIHALDYGQPVRGKRLTHVCTGCGQDDGNWNYWPCPTVQAMTSALTSHQLPTPPGSSGKCNHTQRGITWAEGDTTCYVCETCEHEWAEER